MSSSFRFFHNILHKLAAGYAKTPSRVRLMVVMLFVAILGTYIISTSHAATNVVATEPENGTITTPAAQVTDVTASGGKAVKFGSAGGSLPAGVTLSAIDGGPNYYCSNGMTYACTAGWDNPSFFPIGAWYGKIPQQADANRWKDLGMNTLFRTTGDTNMSLVRSNGLFAIEDDENGTPETAGMGAETVGLLAFDEPPTQSDVTHALSTVPNAQQDGRFWYINYTWNQIAYGGVGGWSVPQMVNIQATTPNGTKRGTDIVSADIYWFAYAVGNAPYEGGIIYGLSGNMPVSEVKCGCRYGDMVDPWRAAQSPVASRPIAQFVENGGPMSEDTTAASYITPPEMNWAVWSSIIHGARMIMYFNHSFAGPAQSDDNFAQSYYQTVQAGQTTSIYAQAKATDGLVAQIAPVINAPTANGYLTVSPAYQTFSGIETVVKYYNGHFYIIADTRESETKANTAATFTIKNTGATTVTVINENRTLPITNGTSFTDNFATGSAVHIYQVN